MGPARVLPVLATLFLTGMLMGDAIFNNRGIDVLLIPALVLMVMAVASLTILLLNPARLSNPHSVSPIAFSHHGRMAGMAVATLLVLIIPRIGIPILTVFIAKYREADVRTALLLGVCAAAMIEVVFIAALGLSFPPVDLW